MAREIVIYQQPTPAPLAAWTTSATSAKVITPTPRMASGGTRGEGARERAEGVARGTQPTTTAGEGEGLTRCYTAQRVGLPMIAPPMYRTRSGRSSESLPCRDVTIKSTRGVGVGL